MTAKLFSEALTTVCTYRVKIGGELAFEALLARHLPTLERLGLIDDQCTRTLRAQTPNGPPCYVEVFTWASADAAKRAAEIPEVIAVWEPMASLCEARDGFPPIDFPLFGEVSRRD